MLKSTWRSQPRACQAMVWPGPSAGPERWAKKTVPLWSSQPRQKATNPICQIGPGFMGYETLLDAGRNFGQDFLSNFVWYQSPPPHSWWLLETPSKDRGLLSSQNSYNPVRLRIGHELFRQEQNVFSGRLAPANLFNSNSPIGPGINVLPHADSDLPDPSLVDLNAQTSKQQLIQGRNQTRSLQDVETNRYLRI